MSLASKIGSTSKAAAAKQQEYKNLKIAQELMKARRKGETAFPSKDIESLVEMSIKVVA